MASRGTGVRELAVHSLPAASRTFSATSFIPAIAAFSPASFVLSRTPLPRCRRFSSSTGLGRVSTKFRFWSNFA